MFYNRDWLTIFSSFRFHQFFKPDFLPRQKNLAPSTAVSHLDNATKQTSPETAKIDTIEKSRVGPDALTTPVEKSKHSHSLASLRPYSPAEILKQACGQNARNSQDQEDACETVEDKPVIQQRSWQNQVNMNLNFNLSQFEHSISQLVEDAEDGEIRTETLTKINLGLHVDLSVKGKYEEKTNDPGLVQDGMSSGLTLVARTRSASKQAMAMQESSRDYQAKMFYRESQRTSFKMKQEYSDGFLRISRKLSMRYAQDFSFNFRSLQAYNSQADQLSQTDDLQAYLNNTEAMVDSSQVMGDTIGRFFDIVQGYLDQAEEKLIGKINDFFDQLASQLGIDAAALDQSREQTLATARAFFEKVDSAFGTAKAKYISADPEPQVIEEPPPVETDSETAPVADTETIDQPAEEPVQTEQPAEEQPVSA